MESLQSEVATRHRLLKVRTRLSMTNVCGLPPHCSAARRRFVGAALFWASSGLHCEGSVSASARRALAGTSSLCDSELRLNQVEIHKILHLLIKYYISIPADSRRFVPG